MAADGPTYSRWHRALEVSAITTFVVFAIGNAWRMWNAIDGPWAALTAFAALLLGYIFADLISGTVHWLADRFGTPETPVFGPHFIVPFRNHHVFPKEITEHDFIETNGNNCIVSFWVLVVCFFLIPAEPGRLGGLFLLGTLEFAMIAIMATNQFHKWAHMDQPPRAVRVLQRLHLVLPPEHHDIHHTAPFDKYFCITTGWLNWPLQKVRFFGGLEWFLRHAFGLKAGEDDARKALTRTGS